MFQVFGVLETNQGRNIEKRKPATGQEESLCRGQYFAAKLSSEVLSPGFPFHLLLFLLILLTQVELTLQAEQGERIWESKQEENFSRR